MARPCRCVGGALQKPETRRPPLPHQPSIVRGERGLSLVPASVPPTPRRAALRPRRGPQCIARGWLPARAAECRRTERLRRGAAAPRSASAPMRQELHPRTHCTNWRKLVLVIKYLELLLTIFSQQTHQPSGKLAGFGDSHEFVFRERHYTTEAKRRHSSGSIPDEPQRVKPAA
jgi:hypothetical protein